MVYCKWVFLYAQEVINGHGCGHMRGCCMSFRSARGWAMRRQAIYVTREICYKQWDTEQMMRQAKDQRV
jgi:hypothetical protein